jgi:hypothetical protein
MEAICRRKDKSVARAVARAADAMAFVLSFLFQNPAGPRVSPAQCQSCSCYVPIDSGKLPESQEKDKKEFIPRMSRRGSTSRVFPRDTI